MNNEAFKRYIVHFVTGGVFGRVAGDDPQLATWRGPSGFIRGFLFLNQEEIRRTLDVVRLRLETGSATS